MTMRELSREQTDGQPRRQLAQDGRDRQAGFSKDGLARHDPGAFFVAESESKTRQIVGVGIPPQPRWG